METKRSTSAIGTTAVAAPFSGVARLAMVIVMATLPITACSREGVRIPAPTPPPNLMAMGREDGALRFARAPTAIAERGKLHRTIQAAGVVRPDERRVHRVQVKISGWVEKLFVNSTGESVKRGSPMLALYSPELLASQEDYLRAKGAVAGFEGSEMVAAREQAARLVAAARRRLELFDVPSRFVDDLARSGHPRRAITLLVPASGVVTRKDVFEGQRVDPGTELYTIADLSHVWIEAEIPEADISAARVGQPARIDLGDGRQLNGQIAYIPAYLNADTRTLSVRFDFPNPDLQLKLDAYANVELSVESGEGVIVPSSAVLDTGVRRLVFVDIGGGRFEPRSVRVGARSEGRVQILGGVAPGERVALKANFLLDSESRLREMLRTATVSPAARSK